MSAVFPSSPSLQSTICHHYQCREAACHRSSSIPSLIPMIVSIFLITLPKIWDPYLPCSSYIFLKFSEKKMGHPSIGGCESQSVTMTIPVVYWICVDWIRDHSTYIASLHKSVRKIRDITHTRNFPQIVIFLGLFDIVIYCDIVYFTSLPGNNSLLTMFLHFSNWPSGSPLCQFV